MNEDTGSEVHAQWWFPSNQYMLSLNALRKFVHFKYFVDIYHLTANLFHLIFLHSSAAEE